MADYCTLAEIKEQVIDGFYNTDYDAGIGKQITAVSRLIDREVGRWENYFYPSATPVTRYYDGSGCSELWIDEFVSISSVAVSELGGVSPSDYIVWSASDYIAWPYNSTPIMRLDVDVQNGSKVYWEKYRKAVKVTGIPGYSTTPPEIIKQACIIQTTRWFMRSKNAWQETGANADVGQVTVNVGGRGFIGSKLDGDVITLLHPFKIAAIGGIP